jgi:hypothetical protein
MMVVLLFSFYKFLITYHTVSGRMMMTDDDNGDDGGDDSNYEISPGIVLFC